MLGRGPRALKWILRDGLLCIHRRRREGLLVAAEAVFAEDLAGRILAFEIDAARVFLGLPLTSVRSANPSATRMRRSRPLLECEGPSSQQATLPTSRTVVSMSLILGMVREPVA